MNNDRFRDGFPIYPNNCGTLDIQVTDKAREVILQAARGLDKCTILNLAAELGTDRNRITKILKYLGIREEFDSIKRSTQ